MTKTIDMQAVESKQIHSIGYDAETNTLAIRFKNWKGEVTSLYHYENFSAEDFEAFKSAESIGRHFGAFIKPFDQKYPFKQIEKTPAA
ncbi:KTSC domain-containing protein [Ralstonia mannitolilytica]|uniref:KTSC domain-containing protein n=1 Tax=Ralstonia mannitolilytica TaxID=105219 RepID=UPI003B84142C